MSRERRLVGVHLVGKSESTPNSFMSRIVARSSWSGAVPVVSTPTARVSLIGSPRPRA
jgi:hypothetical protein